MNFSSHFSPLAQAYLIVGDRGAIESDLVRILEEDHSIIKQGNMDFLIGRFDNFAIEEARGIKELALKRKMTSGKRVFVIVADAMTREAGNALLKTLEEPGEDTHFFIIMPSISRTLPTILSRVRVVKYSSDEGTMGPIDPRVPLSTEFLALSAPERMKLVKDILARVEKEEITKADITAFIESILRTKYEENKKKAPSESLASLATAASYARDQSASLKMILEYFALLG